MILCTYCKNWLQMNNDDGRNNADRGTGTLPLPRYDRHGVVGKWWARRSCER